MFGWKTDVIQLAGTAPTAFQYETRHTSAFYNLPKNTKKQMLKGVRSVSKQKHEIISQKTLESSSSETSLIFKPVKQRKNSNFI